MIADNPSLRWHNTGGQLPRRGSPEMSLHRRFITFSFLHTTGSTGTLFGQQKRVLGSGGPR